MDEQGKGHKLHPPKNVQQIIITVASEPRFEGERKPNNAKTISAYFNKRYWAIDGEHELNVTLTIAQICAPLPTMTERANGNLGVLKTSP